jgi:ubiquinone/menaquinone biosynthesis C-methylase UbiE
MPNYAHIYTQQARAYHALITPEDAENAVCQTLQRLIPNPAQRWVDVGTGTGRIPLLNKDLARNMIGVDLHMSMLRENAAQRARVGGQWALAQGDARALPFPTHCAEVVSAAWALGHFVSWFGEARWAELARALTEMHRLTQPGGLIVILETLSTGRLIPAPPTPGLAAYYAWLENHWGFTRATLQTDYVFANVDEAVARTEFFFGSDLAEKIRLNQWARLPEWTGLWHKRVSGL